MLDQNNNFYVINVSILITFFAGHCMDIIGRSYMLISSGRWRVNMFFSSRYEYHWCDGDKYKKPTSVPAQEVHVFVLPIALYLLKLEVLGQWKPIREEN